MLSAGGTVRLKLIIEPSGHVANVTTLPPFAGTPVGRCLAQRATQLSFPTFAGPPMTVRLPFKVERDRLSKAEVLKVVRSSAAQIKQCPRRRGRKRTYLVAFTIRQDGSVATAEVTNPVDADGKPERCLEAAVRQLRFPAFKRDPMRINMPFSL